MTTAAAAATRIAALTEHAVGKYALLTRDAAPCISGQTVTMVAFRAGDDDQVLVTVDGLDADGAVTRFDVDLADLALPTLPKPCGRRLPGSVLYAEDAREIFSLAVTGYHRVTNLGGLIQVNHDGYTYTVTIPRNYRAHISTRYGWGGTEFIHGAHASPEQDQLLRAAHGAARESVP